MLFSLQAEILKRSQVEEQSSSASLPTSKEEYVLIYSTIYRGKFMYDEFILIIVMTLYIPDYNKYYNTFDSAHAFCISIGIPSLMKVMKSNNPQLYLLDLSRTNLKLLLFLQVRKRG